MASPDMIANAIAEATVRAQPSTDVRLRVFTVDGTDVAGAYLRHGPGFIVIDAQIGPHYIAVEHIVSIRV